jgi:transaldolase
MGASFRNVSQIKALCGCDLLTISPQLLEELANSSGQPEVYLKPERAAETNEARLNLNENQFRWLHNEDEMASDKLNEGNVNETFNFKTFS